MPIYDYQCDQCDHHISMFQKRGTPGPGACTACQSGQMQKQILGCNFSLSGSGWYKDGYGSGQQSQSEA